jgi:hypothetical protein
MSLFRPTVLGLLLLAAGCVPAYAQRRWERFPAPRDPQFYQPRNKLEEFDGRMETILIKGRHWTGTLRAQNGTARVEAIEIRDSDKGSRTTGVIITMVPAQNQNSEELRSLIDYEEIDRLIRAMETMAKADEGVTKLSHFEERYRTVGDFEVIVFKQLTGAGVAAAVEGGFFDRLRLLMTIDDFTKLRWMIVQAKEKLDEVK